MNDNYIECVHCGERFFYDLTKCPHCGVSLYAEEIDFEEETLEKSIYDEILGGILAVAVGWFISGIIGVLNYMVTTWFFGEQAYRYPFQILRYASMPIGTFVGSYVAVAMTKRSAILYGVLVSVLSFSFTILIASYERDLTIQPLFTRDILIWWAFILFAGVAGALTNAKISERAEIDQLFSLPDNEDELYEQLYIKVGYDHARVERLVGLERERFPEASRYYLLKSAIGHWERDNR